MERKNVFAVIVVLAAVLGCTSLAMAQASGNFDAAVTSAACILNTADGSFNNPCGLAGEAACPILDTTIKTSSGNGVTLDIRPSSVDGLFTNTKISTTVTTSTADVGIQVCLSIDGSSNGILPNGTIVNFADGTSAACVTYAQRFQQLSSTFFSTLASCQPAVCTVGPGLVDPCIALNEGTCVPTSAACDPTTTDCAGVCSLPNPNCSLTLILSTLEANSFDFLAQVPNGNHKVHASWSLIGVVPAGGNNNNASVAACVGPGVLTVTQTKIFQNADSSLTF